MVIDYVSSANCELETTKLSILYLSYNGLDLEALFNILGNLNSVLLCYGKTHHGFFNGLTTIKKDNDIWQLIYWR
jgi:hypothetical protein